jgi:hypothetical protein
VPVRRRYTADVLLEERATATGCPKSELVAALSETICLMKEIDEVSARHGGWPGALPAGLDPVEERPALLKVAELLPPYGSEELAEKSER